MRWLFDGESPIFLNLIYFMQKNRERSIFIRFSKSIHQTVSNSIGYFRKIFLKILGELKGGLSPQNQFLS